MSEETISVEEARGIAADWHGGQPTALYAFASTGKVEDPDLLITEITSEIEDRCTPPTQARRLRQLRHFVRYWYK